MLAPPALPLRVPDRPAALQVAALQLGPEPPQRNEPAPRLRQSLRKIPARLRQGRRNWGFDSYRSLCRGQSGDRRRERYSGVLLDRRRRGLRWCQQSHSLAPRCKREGIGPHWRYRRHWRHRRRSRRCGCRFNRTDCRGLRCGRLRGSKRGRKLGGSFCCGLYRRRGLRRFDHRLRIPALRGSKSAPPSRIKDPARARSRAVRALRLQQEEPAGLRWLGFREWPVFRASPARQDLV